MWCEVVHLDPYEPSRLHVEAGVAGPQDRITLAVRDILPRRCKLLKDEFLSWPLLSKHIPGSTTT
jgi:hypothetical protein